MSIQYTCDNKLKKQTLDTSQFTLVLTYSYTHLLIKHSNKCTGVHIPRRIETVHLSNYSNHTWLAGCDTKLRIDQLIAQNKSIRTS